MCTSQRRLSSPPPCTLHRQQQAACCQRAIRTREERFTQSPVAVAVPPVPTNMYPDEGVVHASLVVSPVVKQVSAVSVAHPVWLAQAASKMHALALRPTERQLDSACPGQVPRWSDRRHRQDQSVLGQCSKRTNAGVRTPFMQAVSTGALCNLAVRESCARHSAD